MSAPEGSQNAQDTESGGLMADSNMGFNEESIRKGFVRKVYGILTAQLVVTMGFIALFIFCEPIKMFAIRNDWLYILALLIVIVLIIVLACCDNVRRQYPLNLILLGMFTLCEGFMLGSISSRFDTDAVLIAVGVTVFIVFALTMFAFQTKIDFTYLSGILFVLLLVLLLFGLLCAIVQNRFATLAYACLGALLFSVYLVVDTQMMLGGKHQYSLSPEEYIFAALNLYLDIVNIFMFMLMIVQCSKG